MRTANEQKSFARHFLPELREKGVSQHNITLFVEEVDRIMRYNITKHTAESMKDQILAAKRRALR